MLLHQVLLGIAALPLVSSNIAMAQFPALSRMNVQLQYHEAVAAGSDPSQVRLKIYRQIQTDCQLAAKAFSRRCIINQISIYMNPNYTSNETPILNATANLVLVEGPAAVSPPCPASPAPPASRLSPASPK
jgi:hypothetical protein